MQRKIETERERESEADMTRLFFARKAVKVLFALEWAATHSSISLLLPPSLPLSIHPSLPMPPSKF